MSLDAYWRNAGRFSLSMIPAALGGAAILWIVAAFGWIDLTQAIRMQRRSMASVGISAPPRTLILVTSADGQCLKVESSRMDGDELVFYARNVCNRWLQLPNYSIRQKARDGTVIASNKWAFSGDRMIGPQERREQGVRLKNDDRTETVQLNAID
jgi:hypothetical protein